MRRPSTGSLPAAADPDPIETLERENEALAARLTALTDEASRNDALLRKSQERELELLRAGTLPQLFERLLFGLKSSYQLDGVMVVLNDPQHEIRHLISGDDLAHGPQAGVMFVDALSTVAQTVTRMQSLLGRLREAPRGG